MLERTGFPGALTKKTNAVDETNNKQESKATYKQQKRCHVSFFSAIYVNKTFLALLFKLVENNLSESSTHKSNTFLMNWMFFANQKCTKKRLT